MQTIMKTIIFSITVLDTPQSYRNGSRNPRHLIEGMFAISFADFYKWNPSIGSNCENLWLGYAYCVSAPSDTTSGGRGGPAAPTQTGTAPNCNKYYTVQSGDGCDKIEAQFGITLQQLYQWNPAIGADCTNLWLGYAICVGVSSRR
ncbi:hypothetical protein F5Y14DRAFT_175542 [Nemania sp. NC0429]|nr:hypothetical protein F5Y14DRAFT_175542 [Nemania sp. NC0429]